MTIYTVTFVADNGLSVTILAGEGSPNLTQGFAKWEEVDRPRRVGFTRFVGKSLFKQDIPVRFDGLSTDESQEYDITTLERMAQQGVDLSEPPKIKLKGIALRRDLTWVIDDITFSNTAQLITKGGVAVRVRQDAVVHLIQYVDDTVLTTAASPAVQAQTKKKKVSITTPQGMTLKQIAMLEYKDPDLGMRLILQANTWLSPDPRKIVPAGTPLTIPDISAGTSETFIVP